MSRRLMRPKNKPRLRNRHLTAIKIPLKPTLRSLMSGLPRASTSNEGSKPGFRKPITMDTANLANKL